MALAGIGFGGAVFSTGFGATSARGGVNAAWSSGVSSGNVGAEGVGGLSWPAPPNKSSGSVDSVGAARRDLRIWRGRRSRRGRRRADPACLRFARPNSESIDAGCGARNQVFKRPGAPGRRRRPRRRGARRWRGEKDRSRRAAELGAGDADCRRTASVPAPGLNRRAARRTDCPPKSGRRGRRTAKKAGTPARRATEPVAAERRRGDSDRRERVGGRARARRPHVRSSPSSSSLRDFEQIAADAHLIASFEAARTRRAQATGRAR